MSPTRRSTGQTAPADIILQPQQLYCCYYSDTCRKMETVVKKCSVIKMKILHIDQFYFLIASIRFSDTYL